MATLNVISPAIVKLAQPSAPHRGSIDQAIAQRANGLAFYCSGTSVSKSFPDPDRAPLAELVDYATWYDFNLIGGAADVLFQLPWHQQKQHQVIRAYVTVAFAYDLQVKMRMNASTMVETLTTVEGPDSQVLVADAGSPIEQPWVASTTRFRLAAQALEIQVPSPASDRRCVLSFQAQYAALNNANPYPASSARAIYIHSLCIDDRHQLVEPE